MTVVHLSEPDAGCGCYVNYPDANLHNWRFLYYKENHDQLQQAKAHWDPLNVFNHVQSSRRGPWSAI